MLLHKILEDLYERIENGERRGIIRENVDDHWTPSTSELFESLKHMNIYYRLNYKPGVLSVMWLPRDEYEHLRSYTNYPFIDKALKEYIKKKNKSLSMQII